jgi:outer membrane biosynthesis protein TonB
MRIENKITSFSPANKYAMPFFALRVAGIVFGVLLVSTGLVSASANSQPGQILYPVKQLMNEVKIAFPSDKYISNPPTISIQPVKQEYPTETPAQQPTPTETVTDDNRQTLPASDYKPQESETPTPTPTPAKLNGAGNAIKNTPNDVIQHSSVNTQNENTSQPTPTPQPNNEGSKDNGSNAGAGGSLLPKLKIKL